MSRIDELVERLCPEGVEYRALGEVAGYVRTRVSASSLEPGSYVGVNELLPDYRGRSDEVRLPAEESCIAFEPGDILLGNIRPYLKKLWLADSPGGTNGDVLVIRTNDPSIVSPAFLREVLMGEGFTSYNVQKSRGAKMPRGDKKAILQYRIPVPPLAVQEEVVRVLDSFAELEAELEAELAARRRQYAYYRDQLLDFTEREDVPWLTLGELFNMQAGNAIPAACIEAQQTVSHHVPCYGANGLRGFVESPNENCEAVLIGRQGALCGNVCYANGEFFATEHAVVAKPNESLTSRFAYHLLCYADLSQYKTAGAQPGLSVKRLSRVKVPLPPLAEQQRIVAILDRFDALTTSLACGLPAEIETRRKQYAHYRDRLLAFPERTCA